MKPHHRTGIDDQARDIRRISFAMSQALARKAAHADPDQAHDLTILAGAAELISDKADAIEGGNHDR